MMLVSLLYYSSAKSFGSSAISALLTACGSDSGGDGDSGDGAAASGGPAKIDIAVTSDKEDLSNIEFT